ncbi:glycoside hydrolase family 16 protein [Oryzihumus sp.]|uniref:glycoside hydrolase family 16 protein n=1 Tax=Oryzihumus sp. TaxID=1968903 RepID=UPI002EDB2281
MRRAVHLAAAVLLVSALATCSQPSTPGAGRAAPQSAPVPHGPSGRWALHWADEFNGTSVDLGKWQPNWFGARNTSVTKPVNKAELSCYDPRQVTESGGALHLTAVQRTCLSWQYASGLVSTVRTFQFTYGYAEARMVLPAGALGACTNWPAFWVNGNDGAPIEEIDTMECLGGDVQWHYNWDNYNRKVSNLTAAWHDTMPQTPSGWHTFGVDWEPGSMSFYYDGVSQGSVAQPATHPHYLILNLAVSNTISPPVLVPQTVSIDYVRVFTRR